MGLLRGLGYIAAGIGCVVAAPVIATVAVGAAVSAGAAVATVGLASTAAAAGAAVTAGTVVSAASANIARGLVAKGVIETVESA